MKRLAMILGLVAMWLCGCAGIRIGRSLELGVDGTRKRRLFGVKLPGKLTLGKVHLRTRHYALEPLNFEFFSSVGVTKRRLRGLFLGGQVGLSFRLTDYLVWTVNSSTLLAFVFPDRRRLGFCIQTRARFSI
jgi:hypothetical protein